MSQDPSTDQSNVRSSSSSRPRTWAGTLEIATHYLHLNTFPCNKCKGPVVAGWIGKREDEISRERNVAVIGGVCLLCGVRVEALIATSAANYFRPVEWEWTADNKREPIDSDGDLLSSELSQDADRPRSIRPSEEPQS